MDIVTLGAALSIMKKMPDTAASSAAAAEDAADRAEAAALTLTIDDTLTQTGQAADSKSVGDVVEGIQLSLQYEGIDSYLKSKFKLHMTHDGNGKYITYNSRNAIITPQYFSFPVSVAVASGYKFALQFYDGYETGSDHLIEAGTWQSGVVVIPSETYWCIIVRKSDDSETDNTTQNNLTFSATANFDDVYSKLLPLINVDEITPTGYFIDRAFRKTPVTTELLGQVKYLQSWCKYDGYYFSTDGNHICKQDDSFAEIDIVDLIVGHGNAFQIGNSNLAYISGWDDQKIYVVNMDTLSLDSIITLPTIGYTTCVVDEARKLIYIFQRDTYPSTEEYYNFIVYDYDSEQIISRRKTGVKFAAMQACDFVDDRIIVLNGLGTSAAPDYYRLFDLNGNVIGEYFFPNFSGYEPEGVFIDRSTKEIIIGLNGRNIYKISYID